MLLTFYLFLTYFISEIVNYLTSSDSEVWEGYLYACLYSISSLIICLHLNKVYYDSKIFGSQVKHAVSLLVYNSSLTTHSSGTDIASKVTSTFGSQIDFFEMLADMEFIFTVPVFMIGGVGLMYFYLGIAGIIGICTIIISLPLQIVLSKLVSSIRRKVFENTNERINVIQNVIEGMKIVKIYGWENAYSDLITDKRHQEVRQCIKKSIFRVSNSTVFLTGNAVIILITYSIYVHLGNALTLSQVFAGATLLSVAHYFTTGLYAYGMEVTGNAISACKSITEILLLRKRAPISNQVSDDLNAIEIHNLAATWEADRKQDEISLTSSMSNLIDERKLSGQLCLCEVDLRVKHSEFVVIIGAVGSGKSSLLKSIIGETNILSGEVQVYGNIAYVPQEPWIIPTTLQENIIMGSSLDIDRYEKIIEECCLKDDIAKMPYGDQTVMSDKGDSLSGGQKMRISLARALYANKNIYLLDDPLSAVDVQVSSQIFHKCILGTMSKKTRILVTHQMYVLPYADRIIVIDKGTKLFDGSYSDIQRSYTFSQLIGGISTTTMKDTAPKSPKRLQSNLSKKDSRTLSEETCQEGSVSFKTYYTFLKQSFKNPIMIILFVIYCGIVQGIFIGVQQWLGYWSSQDAEEQQQSYYVYILAILATACFIGTFIRNIILNYCLLISCEKVHNSAVTRVIRANASFFDSNPDGRITERFSKDTFLMDELVVYFFSTSFQIGILLGGYLITIIIINPYLVIVFAFYIIYVILLRRKVVPLSRELRKHELMTRGPIGNLLSSSYAGLSNIQVFGWKKHFMTEMVKLTSNNYQAFHEFYSVLRVFDFYADLGAVCLVAANTFIMVGLKDSTDPSLAAISLSYMVTFMGNLGWFCDITTETDNFMASTQRIMEYSELLTESDLFSQSLTVSSGSISFNNVSMRYREHLRPCLSNLNFDIIGGMKVGVVGRTGSGKSTILQVLLRLYPIHEGSILIDGQDIQRVSLSSLRNKISIIPQNPFTFADTIRKNLDPFDCYTDDQIWSALKDVALDQFFGSLPTKLSTQLHSSHTNLSLGQKQLMCLTRAILRGNKILLIDEATASVDILTDQLIQWKIREKFSNCTVITIAHRIQTIIDSDKILFIDNGAILELGDPLELIEDCKSHFYSLVSALSDDEIFKLKRLAKSKTITFIGDKKRVGLNRLITRYNKF